MTETATTAKQAPARPRAMPSLLWPMVFLILASAVIRWTNLDLKTAASVFDEQREWILADNPVVRFCYHYGAAPSIVAASLAGVVWLGSCFAPRLRGHRRLAMFLALSMVIGPGLIINSALKDHWGRPRPRNVIQFGGDRIFAPVGEPHFGQNDKSFPSGHASMGFYWLGLGIYYYERHRRLAWGWFLLGLVHGSLMGAGRIAQGGHWLSDVLWAAGMVYLTAWLVARFLKPDDNSALDHRGARAGSGNEQ